MVYRGLMLSCVTALLLASLGTVHRVQAQSTAAEPAANQRTNQTDMAWFRDARFGMFIHWGPVSLRGTEIGWSRGQGVPVAEYDELYKRFNPSAFDAAQWVAVAKAAGMKYIVITTKHHDGFCLWDSAVTDYDIMATPFGRDVLAELSAECRKQGIRFCTYYSICDWHHPDYPTDSPGGKGRKPSPDMDRYVAYMKAQLAEIITNYGPVGIIWFDGEWEQPWTIERGDDLYRYVKQLQPDIIINNRVGKVRHGTADAKSQGPVNPGDYDTPEQRIGAFRTDRPWESCITICRQWAWRPNDTMKSLEQCVHTLVRTVGGDGNLLLNVGPMPDGRIEPRQAERLAEIGAWLDRNGQAIYTTRGGPYKPGPWGVSTHRDHTIFLHVLDWVELPDILPPIESKVIAAATLDGQPVAFTQSPAGLRLTLEADRRDPIDTIIRIDLDTSASEIEPIDVPSISVSKGKPATASNFFEDRPKYAPAKAFDGDSSTRWATDWGTHAAWIAVDLGEPAEVGRVRIHEAVEFGRRIERFELQYMADGQWRTAHAGTTVGARYKADFPPVTARRWRLNILQAEEGPTIWQITLAPLTR
jgi:alpha-L-fucosidase